METTNLDVNAYWLERGKTYITEERLFTDPYRHQEQFILESLMKAKIPMGRVLEIGCGFGRLTRRIAEAFPETQITAVDLSPDQLQAARTHCADFGDRIAFHRNDIYSEDAFPGDHYDTILAFEVFMHHPIEPIQALTRRIAAISNNLVTIDWSEEWDGPTGRHVWLHDYVSLYRSAGFTDVRALVLPEKIGGHQQKLFVATKAAGSSTKRSGNQLIAAALPLAARIRNAVRMEQDKTDVAPVPEGRVVLATLEFPKFSETFIVDKFLSLARRGWDVHLAALKSDRSQYAFFPELEADSDLRERVHISPDLDNTLRTLKPKLIHFEFGSLGRDWIMTGRSNQAKTIVSFRGFDICLLGLNDPAFYSSVWQEADAIHLVSRSLWHRATARGCPPSRRHFVIYDAADESFFDDDAEGRAYRDGVGTPERPLRILSVGRLVWQKGYEYALQAVAQLADDGISFEYRIIGDGDQRSATMFAMHDLGIEDSVKLLGALPKQRVKSEMLEADLFLQASLTEGFGVSVAEAQAVGLPVVCSDADGLPENVLDGSTGFVVPRRDPGALAEKLRLLAVDRDLRQRLGEAGRARAAAEFRLQEQMARIEEMYRQVLDLRYQAALLNRALLAEGRPQYEPNHANMLEQELAFMEGSAARRR